MSTTIFDDRDPAFIYQGNWTPGTWNASSVGQSGTLHTTNDQTANVTFTFPVAAIGFTVYGIQRSRGGSYGICIDCDFNSPNFLPVDGFNATDNGANPPVMLYNQIFSDLGVHEIIIRNQADPRGTPAGNSQLAFDRIELQISNTGPATTTSAASTPTDGPRKDTSNTSSTSPPVGAIVGGVLGGLAVLVSLIIFFYWLRLRRRARAHAQAYTASGSAPDDSMAQIHLPPSHQNSSSGLYGGSLSSPGTPLYGAARAKAATESTRTHQPMLSMSSLATTTSSQMLASSSSSQPQPQPRRELDAGPLPAPVEDEEEEDDDTLPPEYGQVFAQRRASRRNTGATAAATTASGPRARALPIPALGLMPVTEVVDEKQRSEIS